jgi:hypothetical protein
MDNREFTRVRTRIPVDVEAGGETISGEIENLSLDGLWLTTTAHFSEQTPCRVTIHLSDAIMIRADGVVVRSDHDGIAVHFLGLLSESYEHLRKLIFYNAVDSDRVEQEFNSHHGLRRVDPPLAPPG